MKFQRRIANKNAVDFMRRIFEIAHEQVFTTESQQVVRR